MSLKQRVLVACVSLVGASTIGVVGPGEASAHQPGTDGCTLSPDVSYVPVYYNFHSSCDTHDLCYGNKPYGNSSAGRLACDNEFRANMRGWCASNYRSWWQAPLRSLCYGVADTYYTAVRTFGGPFF